jgi:hypothetical protein
VPGFNIGGYGGDLVNTLEAARVNRWVITSLGPITSRGAVLVAKELTLPHWKADKLEIMGGSLWYKFAKNIKWEDINVQFYDIPDGDYSAFKELGKWIELVHTNDSGIKVHGGGGYKMDSMFEELDGKGETLRRIRLKYSWPHSLSWGKLNYASSDLKVIDLTLAYDWAEVAGSSH